MELEITNLHDKQIERAVISISAKVTDAIEMIRASREMAVSSEDTLIKVLLELEELYVVLNKTY